MADAELDILLKLKDEASEALKGMSGTLGDVAKTVGGMGLAAIGAGIASVTSFAKTAESLSLLSDKTGFSSEALSTLKYELETNGSSLDGFETSVKKMAVAIESAAGGNQAMIDDFNQLGLNIDTLKAMTPEQQFNTIGLAIGAMTDPTARANEAVKLLGKSGTDMIPVFIQGSAGLDAMAVSAQKAGVVMSEDTMKSGEELQSAIEDLEQSFKGIVVTIGTALAPAIKPLVDGFTQLVQALPIKQIGELLNKLIPPFVEVLLKLMKAIPIDAVLSFVTDALTPLLEVLPDLLDAFAPILEVLGEILKIIPIKPFMELVMSVLMPLLIPALKMVASILKDLEPLLKVIFGLLDDVMKVLGPILEGVAKLTGGVIGTVTNGIGNVIGGIGHLFGIGDGIVQNGQVITTDPEDYIIATKTPQSLGSSGGVTYNFINNAPIMSEYDFGEQVRKFLLMTSSRNTTALSSVYTSA